MTPIDLLVEALVETHPGEAARVLEGFPADHAAAVLREIRDDRATAVLGHMEAAHAAAALDQLEVEPAAAIVAGLPSTSAAVLLRRTATETTDAVLAACPPTFATSVRAVIGHPSRTAGALMDPETPSLPRDLTAEAALAKIREHPNRFKHYLYVVDRDGVLVGVTRLLDIVAAAPATLLEDVMRRNVARLHSEDLEVAVVAHPGWESWTSLPVVDAGDRLVGVIRDDLVRSLRQRARAAKTDAPLSLALSLAELFWLGLAGVTEGVANVVGRETAQQPDEAKPHDR